MSKTKVAVFKPLNKLTFWVSLLATIYVGFAVIVSGLFAGAAFTAGNEVSATLTEFMFLASAGQIGFWALSSIASLVWIYGAARNARVLRPVGFNTTPAWAVGWFFVPIANLYKPFETVRDIWIASKGKVNDRYPAGSPIIVWWWILSVLGNIVMNISSKYAFEGDSYDFSGAEYVYMSSNVVLMASTILFVFAVREVWNFQKNHTVDAADVF